MPSTTATAPLPEEPEIRESVCVHTRKIYDSCRDRDCISDLRVFPAGDAQAALNNASSVRAKSAELLYVGIDIEELAFNRGYYSIDARFYCKINGEASVRGLVEPFTGLSVFNKRVILFASEGNAKVFTSDAGLPDARTLCGTSKPKAVVEAVDPIILEMRMLDPDENADSEIFDAPEFVRDVFPGGVSPAAPGRRLYVTLGQFSIVRLERDSQLMIPSCSYCMPGEDCSGGGDNDPCTLFDRISFPVDEFFPPDEIAAPEGYREALATLTK